MEMTDGKMVELELGCMEHLPCGMECSQPYRSSACL